MQADSTIYAELTFKQKISLCPTQHGELEPDSCNGQYNSVDMPEVSVSLSILS